MGVRVRPFWRYYGGKWRAAPTYPAPVHRRIVEPFAGAAGYSLRYPDREVVLIDRSPIIAGVWRYLIAVSPTEVLAIPDIPDGGTVDDLPACQEARWLAGFWCNGGTASPRRAPSAWARRHGEGVHWLGWGDKARQRIASQVERIRHWRIIEGDYTDAPDGPATWFVDPPYDNRAGSHYRHQPGVFAALGAWCREREGQVIVCENAGATWLPFRPHASIKATTDTSAEVIWTRGEEQLSLYGDGAP